MERLIKDGDIILDGTVTRCEKEKQAFKKLGNIEELLEIYEVDSLVELNKLLCYCWHIRDLKNNIKRSERLWEEDERKHNIIHGENKD